MHPRCTHTSCAVSMLMSCMLLGVTAFGVVTWCLCQVWQPMCSTCAWAHCSKFYHMPDSAEVCFGGRESPSVSSMVDATPQLYVSEHFKY
jgi:hypothetical protein